MSLEHGAHLIMGSLVIPQLREHLDCAWAYPERFKLPPIWGTTPQQQTIWADHTSCVTLLLECGTTRSASLRTWRWTMAES